MSTQYPIGRGWTEREICGVVGGQLVFFNDGISTNSNILLNSINKITVEGEFTYKGVDAGLVLWYNKEIGYIKFTLSPQGFGVSRTYKSYEVALKNIFFDNPNLTVTAPEIDQPFTLKAELHGTNIKCYYNETLVFNLEENTFSTGSFGVYGKKDAVCDSFTVKTGKIIGWARTLQEGCLCYTDSDRVIFKNFRTDNEFSYIEQEVATTLGGKYTLSVRYKGAIHVEVSGAVTLHQGDATSTTLDTYEVTFIADADSTQIKVGSTAVGTVTVWTPQLEQKDFGTSYTGGTRQRSSLSFPAEKINTDVGGLTLSFAPSHSYAEGTLPLFFYNDSFSLSYSAGLYSFKYGSVTLTLDKELTAKATSKATITWINGSSINIDVDGETATLNIVEQTVPYSESIMIGCDTTSSANAVFDDIVICKDEVSLTEIKTISNDDYRIAIKTDFEKDTLVFSRDRIVVPNPKPNTPIVLEDSDGIAYDRVYFIDNGKYVTYNKKKFTYTGGTAFTVEYSEFVDIKAYTDTKVFSKITNSGSVITIKDLADSDIGKELTIEYTPKNVFCAEYNKSVNGYEVQISNTNGKTITVTYENELGQETTLVDTVETNPFKTANNNGFIYITNEAQPMTSLNVKATPETLVADGYQISTITVESLAKNGVPTSNVNLTVGPTKYGKITQYVSDEDKALLDAYEAEKLAHGEAAAIQRYGYIVTDQHRSGRYIYKYQVNDIGGPGTLEERIIFTDTKTNLGTEVLIRIKRKG